MPKIPVEISFRNLDRSDALERYIHERADKLERFCAEISRCRVMVEAPHKHHRKGKIYHVRVDITVPGQEIVVKRDPAKHHAHEDIHVVVGDVFKAAGRQLEDYARLRRGQVKQHGVPPHGRIVELHPGEDYGRLETPGGRLVYFHRNSLLNAEFHQLEIGTEVRFHEAMGERGPQATVVSVIGKHHPVG